MRATTNVAIICNVALKAQARLNVHNKASRASLLHLDSQVPESGHVPRCNPTPHTHGGFPYKDSNLHSLKHTLGSEKTRVYQMNEESLDITCTLTTLSFA